jgi:hypothetical protein
MTTYVGNAADPISNAGNAVLNAKYNVENVAQNVQTIQPSSQIHHLTAFSNKNETTYIPKFSNERSFFSNQFPREETFQIPTQTISSSIPQNLTSIKSNTVFSNDTSKLQTYDMNIKMPKTNTETDLNALYTAGVVGGTVLGGIGIYKAIQGLSSIGSNVAEGIETVGGAIRTGVSTVSQASANVLNNAMDYKVQEVKFDYLQPNEWWEQYYPKSSENTTYNQIDYKGADEAVNNWEMNSNAHVYDNKEMDTSIVEDEKYYDVNELEDTSFYDTKELDATQNIVNMSERELGGMETEGIGGIDVGMVGEESLLEAGAGEELLLEAGAGIGSELLAPVVLGLGAVDLVGRGIGEVLSATGVTNGNVISPFMDKAENQVLHPIDALQNYGQGVANNANSLVNDANNFVDHPSFTGLTDTLGGVAKLAGDVVGLGWIWN